MMHDQIRMQGRPKPSWSYGTFEGARAQVRETARNMSFRDKIRWLEESEALALRFRVERPAPPRTTDALNDHP